MPRGGGGLVHDAYVRGSSRSVLRLSVESREQGEIQAFLYRSCPLPRVGGNVHGCSGDHDKAETIFLNPTFCVFIKSHSYGCEMTNVMFVNVTIGMYISEMRVQGF